MEYQEFSAKTVDDAITEACRALGVPSSRLVYEVESEGSGGFLGMGAKPAVIRAAVKDVSPTDAAKQFVLDVTKAMQLEVETDSVYDETEHTLNMELKGPEMGVLIGKRGQTLDALQYLVSLVVNKGAEEYVHVKLDTENYRARRKATLENLAKNIAFKVKRSRRPVSLEPMNPYERRIIHSALQQDRYVTTHSEGEEPNRRVVVTPKRS
ncbi:MAG: protein jag [Lachnospiraceae bacterium]|nr:protein jag [Lachnospiraceae bacterium]